MVDDCFSNDIMTLRPQDGRLIQFSDYILVTYITNVTESPLQIWTKFVPSTVRTTNNCESVHRTLNRLNSSDPNIF